MLGVYEQPVETEVGEDLRRGRSGKRHHRAEQMFAALELLSEIHHQGRSRLAKYLAKQVSGLILLGRQTARNDGPGSSIIGLAKRHYFSASAVFPPSFRSNSARFASATSSGVLQNLPR